MESGTVEKGTGLFSNLAFFNQNSPSTMKLNGGVPNDKKGVI